jgi:mycothiol synthase
MTGVHPNYRGLRLGRAVVLAGMHYLKSKNISGIELEVDSENIPATKLYNSIGFRKINQTYWYEKSM